MFNMTWCCVTVRRYSGETRGGNNCGNTESLHCRPLLNCLDQSDEKFLSIVREEILVHPDWARGYNLSRPLEEVLQDQAEDKINLAREMDREFFKGKLYNGFFIEAGASNGKSV